MMTMMMIMMITMMMMMMRMTTIMIMLMIIMMTIITMMTMMMMMMLMMIMTMMTMMLELTLVQSVSFLANSEEAFHLSRALEGLARTEEKMEISVQDQADADYAHILELIRDYLALVAVVKEVLGERVKTFLAWQNAVNTLHKKREQRSRMELGGRLDKVRSDWIGMLY